MQIQINEDFYKRLKLNQKLFNAFSYNLILNAGDQELSKFEIERKLADAENFNLLKTILKDEGIDYFINFNGHNEVYNPDTNSLGKNVKPDDWEIKDEGGTLHVVGNDNDHTVGFGPITYTPSIIIII